LGFSVEIMAEPMRHPQTCVDWRQRLSARTDVKFSRLKAQNHGRANAFPERFDHVITDMAMPDLRPSR
jgi:hypothetical protein